MAHITTFASLITTPDTQKVVLAEISVREDVIEGWAQVSAPNDNAWSTSYLYETITLTHGGSSKILKSVTAMQADSTVLTAQSNLADVHSNSNSYWHDTANSILYVNVGGNPETTVDVLLTAFTLYFATEGKDLNSVYYEPYIMAAPNISQDTESLLSGFSVISAGDLVLNNNDGFFNVILDKFVWQNRNVVIKFGGEDLAYGEYGTVFSGQVYNKFWNEIEVNLTLRDNQTSLLRSLPETIFNSTDNPNADSNIIGLPVPLAWGSFGQDDLVTDSGGRTAPMIPAEDDSDGGDAGSPTANVVIYTLADHTVSSADAIWASPDNGQKWFLLTAQSPNTDAPDGVGKWGSYDDTGTIGDASDNSKITVRFAADGGAGTSATTVSYVQGQTRIKAGFKGRENSDTTQMTAPSDTVADLIDTFNDFTSADRNTTSFSESKTNSDNTVSVYLNKVTRTSDIINKICRSEPARFYTDGDGLFNYVFLNPEVDASALEIDRTDLLEFSVEFDQKEHFTKVKVGHQQSSTNFNYLYDLSQDVPAQNKYNNKKQKLINTYLDNSGDAIILGQRQIFIRKNPIARARGRVKWQMVQKNIGDKINITSSRAPFNNTAGYASRQFEIVSLSKDIGSATTFFEAIDLSDFAASVGYWTSDSAPDWSSSTDSQKQQQGYWSDTNGFIDSTDGSSKNASLWF